MWRENRWRWRRRREMREVRKRMLKKRGRNRVRASRFLARRTPSLSGNHGRSATGCHKRNSPRRWVIGGQADEQADPHRRCPSTERAEGEEALEREIRNVQPANSEADTAGPEA